MTAQPTTDVAVDVLLGLGSNGQHDNERGLIGPIGVGRRKAHRPCGATMGATRRLDHPETHVANLRPIVLSMAAADQVRPLEL